MRLLSFLPLPVLATLGYSMGTLVYLLYASRRRIALKNISVCFPELSRQQHKRINRKHFRLLGQAILTVGMNWWISPARFNRLVRISNREHYDRAIEDGKNIILLTPHFLPMEVAGLALQRERPMVGMYQYMKNPLINAVALKGRQRFCPDGIMFERKEPLRKLLRILRKGSPLLYSPDQDADRKGIFVPFFHTLASTTPALAKFAAANDAVVIPCESLFLSVGARI